MTVWIEDHGAGIAINGIQRGIVIELGRDIERADLIGMNDRAVIENEKINKRDKYVRKTQKCLLGEIFFDIRIPFIGRKLHKN